LVFVVAGCQSSGVARRRAQRIDAYSTFGAETRNLVNKGRIQNGMDTNAVFIAWGRPTDAFIVNVPGDGQRLIWNYEEKWFYERKRQVLRGSSYGRPIYGIERWRLPITYAARSATFAGGKVIQWKKYDPPVLDRPPEKLPCSPHAF